METKNYIYWNDKEFAFFNSKDPRNHVINHYDLSYNPNYSEIVEMVDNRFTVKSSLNNMNIGKHFKIAWSGNGLVSYIK